MNAYVVTAARPTGFGALAFGLLLGAYFALLTVVSGWKFTLSQFSEFWFYILPLAGGFGLQVALYIRLRQLLHQSKDTRTVMAASGTTSTAAMISCCAHYLTNVAPLVGATGAVVLIAQYQTELFWVGLAFNAAGIVYIGRKVLLARRYA
jgi:Cu+-exporting ATPase